MNETLAHCRAAAIALAGGYAWLYIITELAGSIA